MESADKRILYSQKLVTDSPVLGNRAIFQDSAVQRGPRHRGRPRRGITLINRAVSDIRRIDISDDEVLPEGSEHRFEVLREGSGLGR